MTNKEKQLLLKNLCARIPYGVKVSARYTGTNELYDGIIEGITYIDLENIEYFVQFTDSRCPYRCGATEARPYLRPMSSMTDKEHKEEPDVTSFDGFMCVDEADDYIEWLNEHHFDYQGLIERGLALEAPEGMYKTE